MTVTTTDASSGPFAPNGSTTSFPFTFAALSAGEVKVVRRDAADVETVLGGYTVTLTPGSGGSVLFSVAPALGDPLYILSDPDFDQQLNLANQGAFSPTALNGAFDRAAIRDIFLLNRMATATGLLDEAAARLAGDAVLAGAIGVASSGEALPNVKIKTPYDFGALGLGVIDTAAIQDFFDDASDPVNAGRYLYDWSGEWVINNTIYACYWDGAEPNVERRFIMGTLRVAPLISLPGGVPLDYVLEIAGYRMRWDGVCGIHPSGAAQYDGIYATRRYKRGVHMRFTSGSTFGDFQVDDSKNDGVFIDSGEGAFTVNGINFPNANCIGTKIGRVYGRFVGSSELYGAAYGPTALVASARQQGRVSGADTYTSLETFDTTTAGYGSSGYQRTKITTVGTTADVSILDLIWCRVELTPAIYGTIAAAVVDASTGTLTWTAGDPTNLDGSGNGLQVGDLYPIFNGGENVNTEFRITSFGGTSNRTIAVSPPPVAHAATSNGAYVQYGDRSWHWVSRVFDANNLAVYPWVPSRINSSFHLVPGAVVRASGGDLANVNIAGALALGCSAAFSTSGVYAPRLETLLAENTWIGTKLSVPPDSIVQGLNIGHGHAGIVDSCVVPILSGSQNISGTINLQSAFDLGRCVGNGSRAAVNSQRQGDGSLGTGLIISKNGTWLTYENQSINEGSSWDSLGISNAQQSRQVYIHTDTATLTVSFDRHEARFFPKHHWAEIIWTDDDGSPPDGTLTLNMEGTLAALGWVFAGAGSGTTYAIAAPTKSLVLKLQYLVATKKVVITRINGA